ncbi:rRNA maturation RNase YbeY [Candidatus Uhrbacteria bacterium]|nr:rRNA maturation RNase YbeY [Candidatus Uhrbacteria bacterium]
MIRVEANQQGLRGGQRVPLARLSCICRAVDRALGLKAPVFVSVAFVDGPTMRRLNRTYRGKDRVTDVLAFPFTQGEVRGEVVICVPQAVRQASEQAHGLHTEIAILLVHGLLHVFGHDHEVPTDRGRMFRLQVRALKELGIAWEPPELEVSPRVRRHSAL